MISRLHIQNYKCLKNEDMEFRPLTVLTGTNSSGKSSVLQAVLLLARNLNPKNRERMYDLVSKYQELPCSVKLTFKDKEFHYRSRSSKNRNADLLKIEETLYFLTANRIGPEDIFKLLEEYKVGDNGEYLFKTFARIGHTKWKYMEQDEFKQWSLDKEDLMNSKKYVESYEEDVDSDNDYMNMVKFYNGMKKLFDNGNNSQKEKEDFPAIELFNQLKKNVQYLYAQKRRSIFSINALVNLWMMRITGVNIKIDTLLQETGYGQIYFTHDGTDMISPFNLGSGMSYLAKVLILCFLAKPGDVVMIENPEIHLHPRAQSRLGEFFAFMASKGIQLIIETHCEHLLSSLRYQVYTERLRPDDVILYYKADDITPFEPLRINKSGRYTDTEGNQRNFPTGFFDVSVRQLLEIG